VGWLEGIGVAIARARHLLTRRIDAAIARSGSGPDAAPVAADLVTGERGAVPPAVLQNYRDAGLAHILVIAGMHMSMVAGLVFVAVRGLLAAIPWIALRYPIKKWTALIALVVMAGYLVISGGSVPTQRAFVMNAIVMLAILFDREAISLRTVGWAALAVLALEPEALVGPSFQLSYPRGGYRK
jgi:competence protein ComEC